MKRVLQIALAFLLAFPALFYTVKSSPAFAEPTNFLVNGSFENGSNRAPWEGYGNTSTSAAYQGSYGYDLPSNWMQQKVNLTPGVYRLYAKVKTVNGSGKLTVKDYGGPLVLSTIIPNQADWADVEVDFTMPAAGQATLFLEISGAGQLYADNFVLVRLGDSNLLVNADFENGANRSPWEGHGNTSASAAYQNSYGYNLPSDWMQQKVNLTPGLYRLYAKVKTVSGSGKLTVKDYGGSPISADIPNQANWSNVQVDFLMPASGQATMFLQVTGAGQFYVDNFVLVRLSSNLLTNGNFENGSNRAPWEGYGNTSASAAYQGSYGYDLPSNWMQQKRST